jgi:tetratricopeptide (TPR) repeat protein
MKNFKFRMVFFAGVMAACGAMLPLGEENRLSPADFVKITEESQWHYQLSVLETLGRPPAEGFTDALWPQMRHASGFPVVTGQKKEKRVTEYDLSEPLAAEILKAEEFFKKGSYEKALPIYKTALSLDPKCYLLYSDIGDCHLFSGDPETAISYYDRAIKLNPADHRTYTYKGNALFGLKKYEEARALYARALALRPRNTFTLGVLEKKAEVLGVKIIKDAFVPPVFIKKEAEGTNLYFDPRPYWLAYGLCKSAWASEPSHRKKYTGEEDHNWTTTEERQCLDVLLQAYGAERAASSFVEDENVEFLLKITEEEMLDCFIIYELGSRAYPDIVLLLDDAMQERMTQYVLKFVLPRTEEAPPPQEAALTERDI